MTASTWNWILLFVVGMLLSWFFEKVLGYGSYSLESLGVRFLLLWIAMCTWIPLLADALHQSRDPGKKVK